MAANKAAKALDAAEVAADDSTNEALQAAVKEAQTANDAAAKAAKSAGDAYAAEVVKMAGEAFKEQRKNELPAKAAKAAEEAKAAAEAAAKAGEAASKAVGNGNFEKAHGHVQEAKAQW